MSKKLLALLVAVSTCCAFGCSDDDSDSSCKMGEKRCDGNNAQICVNGNWSKGTPCADGCDKATGVCKEKAPETGACTTAGEKRCSGKKLQECKDGNWSKVEDCKDSCDDATKACVVNPIPNPGNECAPGVTNKDCTPACSADKATGYFWNSKTDAIGSKPCPNKDCYIDGTSVKCREVETCDKNSKKKTCVDANTVSFCNKNGEVQTQTCNSCTLNADSTYYCCNGDNSKCESTDKKCEEGGTEYCLKHCLDDGSKGYYYKQGKVEVVDCSEKKDCTINAQNHVVCKSKDNAGGGSGTGGSGDATLPSDVPATCDKNKDKALCSKENNKPYICGDKGTYYQGKCESGSCFVCPDGWVGCGASEEEFCKTHQKPVLPSDVPKTCVKGESEAMCSTVDHKPYICGVTGYYQGKCESGSCFKCPDGWVGCGASETEFCKDHQKKADK